MAKVGIVWFDKDLRLHDNPSLLKAADNCDQLICVYCFDPNWLLPNRYGLTSFSANRLRFLNQSLIELDSNLRKIGQKLVICYQHPIKTLVDLINRYQVCALYRNRSFGYYENWIWNELQKRVTLVRFEQSDVNTLFNQLQLDSVLDNFPKHFNQFRHQVEHLPVATPLDSPDQLPPIVSVELSSSNTNPFFTQERYEAGLIPFNGGESHALCQLESYFAESLPSNYKSVRDQLDGWNNSTKFSPWLSNGCLSIRQLYSALKAYEAEKGENESTYWIYFELLWREFFQWNAYNHGAKIFHFKGVKSSPPLTSFYPERFQKWCHGNTPYPLVNACMHQLNSLGFMSNRGRQIVASCLVNELGLDWRYGAAYFEQQLIDYDVAVNWGNWQYLAGVGADPRGQRHFNLDKQAELFDKDGQFVKSWHGETTVHSLDSVDAADWPI